MMWSPAFTYNVTKDDPTREYNERPLREKKKNERGVGEKVEKLLRRLYNFVLHLNCKKGTTLL